MLLHEVIDDTVEIDGQDYQLDLSFDNVLLLIDMLNDNEVKGFSKVAQGIWLLLNVSFLYPPEKQVEIFKAILDEYVKEEEVYAPRDRHGNPMPQAKEERAFCLKFDAELIYAGFRQTYGIDLHEEHGRLHWQKFKALLVGLPDNTRLKQVINIRTMDVPKGNEKERSEVLKAKRLYALLGLNIEGGE